MILSFRSRALEKLWGKNDPRGLNPHHVSKLRRLLVALNEAGSVEMMNMPTYRLHKLSNESPERWSVHVNGNWRLTFSFEDGDAFNVDYEDYH
jgi:proteic killer suppression protein